MIYASHSEIGCDVIARARENMQFEKVKKEITNSKKRDLVRNHTCYAKKKILQKVRNAVQKSSLISGKNDKGLNNVTI